MKNYSLAPANHNDYRDFLLSRFLDIQAKDKKFSLLNCANKSGVAKSHLQFLFKKERHVSLDKFASLSAVLKLTDEEEHFTYLLICKNTSKNPMVQEHFESIMRRIRNQFIKSAITPPPSVEMKQKLHEDELAVNLKALIHLDDFKEDPKWIMKNFLFPDLDENKIKTALNKLQLKGEIKRNNLGILRPTSNKPYVFKPDPYDLNGHQLYKKAADFTSKLMDTPNKYCPSVYMTLPLPMDEDNLKKTEQYMIDVHHQICKFSKESKKPTATIYMANFFVTLMRLK
jgi:transcriptional regulator with XRE-family HTH domain